MVIMIKNHIDVSHICDVSSNIHKELSFVSKHYLVGVTYDSSQILSFVLAFAEAWWGINKTPRGKS